MLPYSIEIYPDFSSEVSASPNDSGSNLESSNISLTSYVVVGSLAEREVNSDGREG